MHWNNLTPVRFNQLILSGLEESNKPDRCIPRRSLLQHKTILDFKRIVEYFKAK